MRFLVLPAVLSTLLVALLVAPDGSAGSVRSAVVDSAAGQDPRVDLAVGLEVLRQWDARRARAWVGGDEAALRSLYVHGSSAGAADVRLLRSYVVHRVVVRRLVTQVFAVQLLHRDAARLRMRVFDRVAGGRVTRGGRPAVLPSSAPAARVVQLRLVGPRWRVAAVVPVVGGSGVSGSGTAPRGRRR